MNNRQLAIQELYKGLISKYGINPNAKRLISVEIQDSPRVNLKSSYKVSKNSRKKSKPL